jgi:hypothetical protein
MLDGQMILEVWDLVIYWMLVVIGFPIRAWLWLPDWAKSIVYFLLCAFATWIMFLVWKNRDAWRTRKT